MPLRAQKRHYGGMRSFNIAGPVVPEEHYHLPPLSRMDLDGVLHLIHSKKYFVLHAPRQTGKTSALLALQKLLNGGSEGDYRCVYAKVEVGQAARDDLGQGMHALLAALALGARAALGDEFIAKSGFGILESFGPAAGLMHVVSRWARADPRPLVLLIDEIDALVGDTLVSVLRQLQSGYILRPRSFPASIVLCGVRDLRDCRIESGTGKPPVMGGSAFNISACSLRLADFSRAEVAALLGQHTAETGQAFQAEAVERVWTQTRGQPWLVNALCEQACRGNARERDCPVTEDAILEAQERLILERSAPFDQLADKLREDRVRRVIEPLASGGDWRGSAARDLDRLQDLAYVRNLGLIAVDGPLRIANPIYAEIVPRELTAAARADLAPHTVS